MEGGPTESRENGRRRGDTGQATNQSAETKHPSQYSTTELSEPVRSADREWTPRLLKSRRGIFWLLFCAVQSSPWNPRGLSTHPVLVLPTTPHQRCA